MKNVYKLYINLFDSLTYPHGAVTVPEKLENFKILLASRLSQAGGNIPFPLKAKDLCAGRYVRGIHRDIVLRVFDKHTEALPAADRVIRYRVCRSVSAIRVKEVIFSVLLYNEWGFKRDIADIKAAFDAGLSGVTP